MQTVKIFGINITSAHMGEIHEQISRFIEKGGPSFVVSGNVHGLNLAKKYQWMGDLYNCADLVRVDGSGVVLGARLLGYQINKRITWADWGRHLAEYLAEKGHSLYLLGGPKGLAEQAARKLQHEAPQLDISGAHHGFFHKNGPENDAVIRQINRLEPDILVVGMGMPTQEKWIMENYSKIHAKVFMTAGAAFEYLSGRVTRCPYWMREKNLEWLYRLFQNPKEMSARYLWGNTLFMARILMERFKV